jgi:superoxide reductase
MTNVRDIYRCELCGNIVEVLHVGGGTLVCCGQPMTKLDPKTEDSTKEKHVPFIEPVEGGFIVRIGQNQEHPMLENHYIEMIEVIKKDRVGRVELKPGDKPEAMFTMSPDDVLEVREYCNVHGLWTTKK